MNCDDDDEYVFLLQFFGRGGMGSHAHCQFQYGGVHTTHNIETIGNIYIHELKQNLYI